VKSRHGEICVFEKSIEYKEFKQDYIAKLDCLSDFAGSHPGLCDADNVKEAFAILKSRLFHPDNDFFQDEKHALYGAGKKAIDELVNLVHNDQVPIPLRNLR
jgi:hypothetical protein